ncbi:MAG: hypothetical protein K6E59_01855 [Bacilli bacterium]|nr:hypothetical protein [Bacilli bacterium]
MKINRVLLYAQLIAMYVMHTPLYAILVLIRFPRTEALDAWVSGLLIASLVLMALAFPLCLLNAGFSIASIFKGEESPTKTTMVVKVALIPWYALNFVFCFLLVAGFMNPWLMLAIPVLVGVLVSVTYLFMLSTTLPDVAFLIRQGWKRRVRPNGLTIVGLVFLFFFCLDILGAVFVHIGGEKKREDVPTET